MWIKVHRAEGGAPIVINTDHIVYYRDRITKPGESLGNTLIAMTNFTFGVVETVAEIEILIFKARGLR